MPRSRETHLTQWRAELDSTKRFPPRSANEKKKKKTPLADRDMCRSILQPERFVKLEYTCHLSQVTARSSEFRAAWNVREPRFTRNKRSLPSPAPAADRIDVVNRAACEREAARDDRIDGAHSRRIFTHIHRWLKATSRTAFEKTQ